MSTETKTKGRLHWLIPILEFVVVIAYLAIGFGAIADALKNMEFGGMFESVKGAMIFLVVATAVNTILCFVPVFKSKSNTRIAIWNIVWMILTVLSI